MANSEINLETLKNAVNSVLDHLIEDLKLQAVPIEDRTDFYWNCPAPQIYDMSSAPRELTVGRLSDDNDFIQLIRRGQSGDVSYNLVHLAPLLRYIGEAVMK